MEHFWTAGHIGDEETLAVGALAAIDEGFEHVRVR